MRRYLVLAGPIVATLLLLGACDDDDDGGGPSTIGFDSGSNRVDSVAPPSVPPPDAQADVAVDAAAEAGLDAGIDAEPDADADAGELAPPPTNLEVWLRSDRGVTASNGKISAWLDQSGKGHDFSQTNASLEPVLVGPDAGETAVQFTGTEHLMASTTTLLPTNASALTVVVVFSTPSPAGQQILFNYGQDNDNQDNSNIEIGISTGTSGDGSFGIHRGASIGTTSAAGLVTANVKHRAILRLAATGNAPANILVNLDGTDQATSNMTAGGYFSAGTYNTTSAPMEIGARIDGNFTANTDSAHLAATADSTFVGFIYEVLVYKGGIADSDLPALETYLESR